MSHTETPWSVVEERGDTLITNFKARIATVAETYREEECKANAEFICHAVNCHEELVAACKACLEMFGNGGDPKKVIAKVEAAIAKARGEA